MPGCANAHHSMFVHAHILFFTHGILSFYAEVVQFFGEDTKDHRETSAQQPDDFSYCPHYTQSLYRVSNPLHS